MRFLRRALRWIVIVLVLSLIPAALMALNCTGEVVPITGRKDPLPAHVQARLDATADYRRDEDRTYLTFPEWFIVYISQDYGAFLVDKPPSAFPYWAATSDFWTSYCGVTELASARYQTNWGAHVMIYVIGVSHSVEYLLKGLYENTVGRLFEWLAAGKRSGEEIYAQKVAADYGAFLNETPWYEYPFAEKLEGLWTEPEDTGASLLRVWERRLVLSAEYALKAGYGGLIKAATGAAYAPAETEILMLVGPAQTALADVDPRIKIEADFEGGMRLIRVPRYAAFSEIVARLAEHGVPMIEIAGNDEILVTALSAEKVDLEVADAKRVFVMRRPTSPLLRRGLSVRVDRLGAFLTEIANRWGRFEHAYDY